jgi:hypothetical protein
MADAAPAAQSLPLPGGAPVPDLPAAVATDRDQAEQTGKVMPKGRNFH